MGGRSIGLGRFGSPPMKSPPLPISRTNLESPVGASSDGEESEYGSSPSGQTSEPLAFSARRRSANCSRRAGSCAFRVSSPRSVRCLGCCSAVLFSLYFLMLHVSRPPFAQCASCLSTRSSSCICLGIRPLLLLPPPQLPALPSPALLLHHCLPQERPLPLLLLLSHRLSRLREGFLLLLLASQDERLDLLLSAHYRDPSARGTFLLLALGCRLQCVRRIDR